MATTTRSRKAKGRKLQQFIRDKFRLMFKNDLEDEDIESRQMGGAGTDIVLSPLAKKKILLDIECKNQEKFNINSALAQATANSKDGRIPIVIFKKNHSDVYVSLLFDDFLKLVYPEKYPILEVHATSDSNDNISDSI